MMHDAPYDDTSIVDGIRIRPGLVIPGDELQYVATTGGGPGGQHVNRSRNRIELRFDLAGSPSLDEEQKARIRAALAGRISRDGVLGVVSFRHRSQHQNRETARERFAQLLTSALEPVTPRRPTRPGRAARERRLEDKRRRSETKNRRRSPD